MATRMPSNSMERQNSLNGDSANPGSVVCGSAPILPLAGPSNFLSSSNRTGCINQRNVTATTISEDRDSEEEEDDIISLGSCQEYYQDLPVQCPLSPSPSFSTPRGVGGGVYSPNKTTGTTTTAVSSKTSSLRQSEGDDTRRSAAVVHSLSLPSLKSDKIDRSKDSSEMTSSCSTFSSRSTDGHRRQSLSIGRGANNSSSNSDTERKTSIASETAMTPIGNKSQQSRRSGSFHSFASTTLPTTLGSYSVLATPSTTKSTLTSPVVASPLPRRSASMTGVVASNIAPSSLAPPAPVSSSNSSRAVRSSSRTLPHSKPVKQFDPLSGMLSKSGRAMVREVESHTNKSLPNVSDETITTSVLKLENENSCSSSKENVRVAVHLRPMDTRSAGILSTKQNPSRARSVPRRLSSSQKKETTISAAVSAEEQGKAWTVASNNTLILRDDCDIPTSTTSVPTSFEFDAVFDEDATTEQIYSQWMRPMLDSVVDGRNATIFTYGAAGTGKTYIMHGVEAVESETSHGKTGNIGLIQMTAHDLFVHLRNKYTKSKDETVAGTANDFTGEFTVKAQYFEIYDEQIRDLLVDDKASATLGRDELLDTTESSALEDGVELSVQNLTIAMKIATMTKKKKLMKLKLLSGASPKKFLKSLRGAGKSSSSSKSDMSLTSTSASAMGSTTGASTAKANALSRSFPVPTMIEKHCNSVHHEETAIVQVRDDPSGNPFVPAREEIVQSADDIIKLLEIGKKNKTICSTDLDGNTSSSHTIFRLSLEQKRKASQRESSDGGDTEVTETIVHSVLNMIDLAGIFGDDQFETKNSDQSLSSLSKVINSLRASGDEPPPVQIPYRESMLTRILQPHLSGNASMGFLCCASPSLTSVDETISTLNFATNASKVVMKPVINETVDQQKLLAKLQKELTEARAALINLKSFVDEPQISAPHGVPSVGTAKSSFLPNNGRTEKKPDPTSSEEHLADGDNSKPEKCIPAVDVPPATDAAEFKKSLSSSLPFGDSKELPRAILHPNLSYETNSTNETPCVHVKPTSRIFLPMNSSSRKAGVSLQTNKIQQTRNIHTDDYNSDESIPDISVEPCVYNYSESRSFNSGAPVNEVVIPRDPGDTSLKTSEDDDEEVTIARLPDTEERVKYLEEKLEATDDLVGTLFEDLQLQRFSNDKLLALNEQLLKKLKESKGEGSNDDDEDAFETEIADYVVPRRAVEAVIAEGRRRNAGVDRDTLAVLKYSFYTAIAMYMAGQHDLQLVTVLFMWLTMEANG